MNNIDKVSEVTYEDVGEYIHLSEITEDEQNLLNNLINISKAYIMGYTGHTLEELDNYKDFVIVLFILCQDMWDNRTLYIEKSNLNSVVDNILGMHSVNLL